MQQPHDLQHTQGTLLRHLAVLHCPPPFRHPRPQPHVCSCPFLIACTQDKFRECGNVVYANVMRDDDGGFSGDTDCRERGEWDAGRATVQQLACLLKRCGWLYSRVIFESASNRAVGWWASPPSLARCAPCLTARCILAMCFCRTLQGLGYCGVRDA